MVLLASASLEREVESNDREMRKDEGTEKKSVRRLNGDGLSVLMESNDRVLVVTGDGCRIRIARNSGSVRIVGDGCSLRVTRNLGEIIYHGDGGHVLLGPESSRDRIKYVGVGGKISYDRVSSRSRRNHVGEDVAVDEEEDREKGRRIGNDDGLDDRRTGKNGDEESSIVLENLENERREKKISSASEKPLVKDKDKIRGYGRTVFVTANVVTVTRGTASTKSKRSR